MINWLDGPPPEKNLPHLPLVRVPGKTPLAGAITCSKIVQVYTHFLNRRTQPCMTEDCPGCAGNLAKRYEAYCSIWTTTPGRHIIVALTPEASIQIKHQCQNWEAMRGVYLKLERPSKRPNGRVTAEIDHNIATLHLIPPAPDLEAHLLKIWGLDQSHLGQDQPQYVRLVTEKFTPRLETTDAHTRPE